MGCRRSAQRMDLGYLRRVAGGVLGFLVLPLRRTLPALCTPFSVLGACLAAGTAGAAWAWGAAGAAPSAKARDEAPRAMSEAKTMARDRFMGVSLGLRSRLS